MRGAPEQFLAELRRRGYSLRADGDALCVSPSAGLSPEDVAGLRRLKPELLALLHGGVVIRPDPDDVAGWDDPRLVDATAYQAAWGRLRALVAEQTRSLGCPHLRREFRRVLYPSGIDRVLEICDDCGRNVRGTHWVAFAEVGGAAAVKAMPVWKDRRKAGESSPLFDQEN